MSASDSESENVGPGETANNLEAAGRALVHDVATPLATIQLNLQVLTSCLPKLMGLCGAIAEAPLDITPNHLKALASLPSALDADVRKIRHAVQLFSTVLVPGSPVQVPPAQQAFNHPNTSTNHPNTSTNHPNTSTLRVLLVEDEEVHQQIAFKQLAGRCLVDVAATGREALDLVAHGSYDLILLDLMLSGQDGRGLVGELRVLSGRRSWIILVSNMPLDAEEVVQLEVDGALEKPFRFASMEALLQHLESGVGRTNSD